MIISDDMLNYWNELFNGVEQIVQYLIRSTRFCIMICETKTVIEQTVFQLWFGWSIVSNAERRKMTLTLIFAWTIECSQLNWANSMTKKQFLSLFSD